MARFSDGSIHKKKVNGRWQWQGLIYKYEDDGRRRSLSRTWGIECSPLTEEERGAGRRHAPKGKGARAALAALREWRASLVEEAGGDEEETKASGVAAMQMGDFMEAYWATRRIKKSTMKGYHNLKKHIVMLPGRACDVEPADVQQWIVDEQKGGVGAPTIKKSYVAMKSAFEWAVKMRYLDRNPCTPVEPPKTERRDPNPVDEPNLSKLAASLAALDSNGNRQLADAVRFALFTGMRQGELCGMRWRDVDGAIDGDMDTDGLIHIDNTIEIVEGGTELTPRPKNGVRRDVPINVDASATTSCWRSPRRHSGGATRERCRRTGARSGRSQESAGPRTMPYTFTICATHSPRRLSWTGTSTS